MTAPAPRRRATWAWWALACTPAFALELGEIEVLSPLGRPLQAEIAAGSETLDEVQGYRLRVAGPQAYAAAGRDRPAFLDSVTLGWLQRNDTMLIDVDSRLRANEPLFELMLEVELGTTATLRRGYTVILDLPGEAPAPFAERLPEFVDLPPASIVMIGAPPAPEAAPQGNSAVPEWLEVHRGQTLSALARSLRPDGSVSLHRLLLSLFRANPDAFMNGDMSRLKAGARLRVPDRAEIARLSADPPQPGDPNVGGPKRRWPPRKLTISPSLSAVPVAARDLKVQPSVPLPRPPAKPEGSMHLSPQLGSVEAEPAPVVSSAPKPEAELVRQIAPVRQAAPVPKAAPALVVAQAPRAPASQVAAVEAPPAGSGTTPAPPESPTTGTPPQPAESPVPEAPIPEAPIPEAPVSESPAPEVMPEPVPATGLRFDTLVTAALLTIVVAVAALLLWLRRRQSAAASAPALPAPPPAKRVEPRMVVAKAARPVHPSQVVVDDHPTPAAGTPAGFYAEIAGLLESSLERAPIRHDLRLKLLEMYHAAGMAPAFVKHARAYHSKPGPRDPGWAEIERMGRELAPDDALFGGKGAGGPRQQRFYEGLDGAALAAALGKLEADYQRARADAGYHQARDRFFADHAGRPTPIVAATAVGNTRLFLKLERADRARDDQLINALGQVFLARQRGCKGVIVGSLDGSHGIAAAGAARHAGLACTVIMGPVAMREYAARAAEMRDLGAEVIESGADPRHAEDPRRTALRRWLEDPAGLQFINGLSAGPPPFPSIVRDLQATVGEEFHAQLVGELGGMPAAIVANAAEGHTAVGTLAGFLHQPGVRLLCVESGAKNAERRPLLREHGWLRSTGRVEYLAWDNMDEAMSLADEFSIIHSMTLSSESACAVACARQIAEQVPDGSAIGVLVVGA